MKGKEPSLHPAIRAKTPAGQELLSTTSKLTYFVVFCKFWNRGTEFPPLNTAVRSFVLFSSSRSIV